MKKIFFYVIVIIGFMLNAKVMAISKDFEFVINTIGIPRYNSYGNEVNEDVYYTYNVFSYGSPGKTSDKNQRWKDSKYGYWTKSDTKYNGKGVRGEYNILGRSYSGALIYNYYFPMDVIPNTTPEHWTFYTYPGALESWKDTSKYKYKEQLSYMKTQKLMFNDISSRAKADNPKYIKEYNITAEKIGLSKARLDVAATWKTNGMISTRRNIGGVIYSQVYLVKPMAASAKLETTINVGSSYVLSGDKEELIIPIKYMTKINNMTGYAKAEHVKEIKTELYINGNMVEQISGSKITSRGNEYFLVINRDNFPPNKNYNVKIDAKGYMHTEFVVDGLMRSNASTSVNVYVEPKPIIPVNEKEIRVLEKDTLYTVVRPLPQTIITEKDNSVGFTEAGKHLIIKLNLNVENGDIKDNEVYLNGNRINKINVYDSKLTKAISFQIPKNMETTLYGEYSLRKKQGDYSIINKSELGLRKESPHEIKIVYKYNDKEYNETILFDTLDDYMTNINTINNKTILNKQIIDNKVLLEDWIKNE